jgi:hypothetical protein
MTGRPDDGYRVAARIESRSRRRGRVLAIAFGVIVVAWGATVLGTGPADRGVHATGSGAIGNASPPDGSRPPTFPPDVVVLDQRAPTARLPLRLGGLVLLDPRAGTVQSLAPVDWLQFPFAMADGVAACICIEPGAGNDDPSILHAMTFFDNGTLVSDIGVPGWLPLGSADGIAIDARRIPGGQAFVVASAIRKAGRWSVRLDWLDTANGDSASRDLGIIDGATWSNENIGLGLAIAPDGRRLRLWVGGQPGDAFASPPPPPRIWTVPIADRGFGAPAPRIEPWPQDRLTFCFAEAWASATIYVQLCRTDTDDGSGAFRTSLRIDRGTGKPVEVEVANGYPQEAEGSLIDGTRGVVYAWFGLEHRLVRIDVATGELTERYPGDGRTNLRGIPPEAPMPPVSGEAAIWQPIGGSVNPLVGSPDGLLVYAAGLEPRTGAVGGSPYESTGIWAFDTATLALVGHWPAAADYNVLAVSADGRFLAAFGPPDGEEMAQFGNHGPLIVFHDARDGTVLSILRGLTLHAGGDPEPLAPPLPGGFGG